MRNWRVDRCRFNGTGTTQTAQNKLLMDELRETPIFINLSHLISATRRRPQRRRRQRGGWHLYWTSWFHFSFKNLLINRKQKSQLTATMFRARPNEQDYSPAAFRRRFYRSYPHRAPQNQCLPVRRGTSHVLNENDWLRTVADSQKNQRNEYKVY